MMVMQPVLEVFAPDDFAPRPGPTDPLGAFLRGLPIVPDPPGTDAQRRNPGPTTIGARALDLGRTR
ncbi:hypothetical protein [Streptomyces sp. AcH 505]|uniref:hypothetical protein n=1 Tax=Streptomyces sp. AcH 505 TaxID=352211 RepID=UPI0018E3F638